MIENYKKGETGLKKEFSGEEGKRLGLVFVILFMFIDYSTF
jgi:hypothetical protein